MVEGERSPLSFSTSEARKVMVGEVVKSVLSHSLQRAMSLGLIVSGNARLGEKSSYLFGIGDVFVVTERFCAVGGELALEVGPVGAPEGTWMVAGYRGIIGGICDRY